VAAHAVATPRHLFGARSFVSRAVVKLRHRTGLSGIFYTPCKGSHYSVALVGVRATSTYFKLYLNETC